MINEILKQLAGMFATLLIPLKLLKMMAGGDKKAEDAYDETISDMCAELNDTRYHAPGIKRKLKNSKEIAEDAMKNHHPN